mmetsp:Transcript_4170/g.8473  ORF Transcript_4170/g.8473 Transcript_4170/m.8473 type:complete len:105 (-) Transcript_4170:467-781(-)
MKAPAQLDGGSSFVLFLNCGLFISTKQICLVPLVTFPTAWSILGTLYTTASPLWRGTTVGSRDGWSMKGPPSKSPSAPGWERRKIVLKWLVGSSRCHVHVWPGL